MANSKIPIEYKKDFLKWLLTKLNRRQLFLAFLIEYLINHEQLLENIYFVRSFKKYSRCLKVYIDRTGYVRIQFFKGHIMTRDLDKLFHDIRLHINEPLFIHMKFNQFIKPHQYFDVLEDHPFDPDVQEKRKKDAENAQNILDEMIHNFTIEQIKKEIDLALEEKNREKFDQLVRKLHQYAEEDQKESLDKER